MNKGRYALLLLAVICLAIGYVFFNNSGTREFWVGTKQNLAFEQGEEGFEFEEEEGEESENPLKRLEYEYDMLKDPATGRIPFDIRSKELEFAKTIVRQERVFNLRSAAAGVNQSNASAFVSRGPYNVGGRTRALAIDITDENVILAGGVSGGVWRTADKGATWTRTSSVSQLPSVTTIIQDKRSGKTNNWYYATGEFFGNSASVSGAFYLGDGIHKSTDGGRSWVLLDDTSIGHNTALGKFGIVHKMAIDNSNTAETEIYVAGLGEIVRTTDEFQSIQTVLGTSNTGSNFSDVVVSNSGRVIASIANSTNNGNDPEEGLFKSDDGLTWSRIVLPSGFPASYERMELTLDPQNQDLLYTIGTNFLYQYNLTTDTWQNLTSNLNVSSDAGQGHNAQGGYNLVVAVHPGDQSTLFVGGTNLLRSTDQFATAGNRVNIGGYQHDDNPNAFPNYPEHHPDLHAIAFMPSDPNQMLTGSDGGVHLTTNNKQAGASNPVVWQSLNNGYTTGQFYAIDVVRQNRGDELLIGGLQDNGTWISQDVSFDEEWQQILGGDGAYCALTYNSIYLSAQEGQMRRFEIQGNSPVYQGDISPSNSDDEFLFINPFIHDRVNQDRMFVGASGKLYYTQNVRQNPGNGEWESVSASAFTGQFISALATSVQPEGVLYFGTRGGRLFRVNNTKGDISQVNNITGTNLPQGGSSTVVVSGIAVDPRNADRVFATFGNYGIVSVWMSENGGGTWTSISGNLEQNANGTGNGPSVRSIEILPDGESGELVFVGTSTGLYMTDNLNGPQTVWTQQAADVIGSAVVNMVKVRPVDGMVLAGTHGNGVFAGSYDVGFNPEINYSIDGASRATLRANVSFTSGQGFAYRWLKDGAEIAGQTSSTLIALESGTYRCEVTDQSGPTALTNEIVLNFDDVVTGIDDPLEVSAIVSPNPSVGVFRIKLAQEFSAGFAFTVIDGNGKSVKTGDKPFFNTEEPLELDLTAYPDGLYILQLRNSRLNKSIKLLKQEN